MIERWAILVTGVVQGVGFRPFVYDTAKSLGLTGWVRNEVGGVRVQAQGDAAALEEFVRSLQRGPALARVENLTFEKLPLQTETQFEIAASGQGTGSVVVTPDAAICADCLRELFDPADRRYRYAFINCTNCGPRLTIVTGAPYDRPRTTMAHFNMCDDCRREYEDPRDRRFHAQPVACPKCGPKLRVLDREGNEMPSEPIEVVADVLRRGGIAAIKGIGGFHLACDATNENAVAELRRRKHRDEKPFAVMVRDTASAQALCELSGPERDVLMSWRRPIVLLKKRPANSIAESVAPSNPFLGVMTAYAPVHLLLFATLQRADSPTALVMTSGNRADEPIAYDDAEAVERLHGIADIFLVHNREIHTRCDDSVTRITSGAEYLMRRSRGYAPEPVKTIQSVPALDILAVGGQLKNTFALRPAQSRDAIVSHHLGDLDHLEAYRAFVRDIALYEDLFAIRPRIIAHDLHPDYASTRYARERAAKDGLELVAVQHHHAHMASCMADNGLDERVIGVSFDGTGYGTDGAIWGGEFLVGDFTGFERAAHLRYVGLPGGDAAVKEIWRMGLVHMLDSGAQCRRFAERLNPADRAIVETMLGRNINTPQTSSMGRLFDALAAIVGVHGGRGRVSFEGQGAMELEWLAEAQLATCNASPTEYRFVIQEDDSLKAVLRTIDPRPVVRRVCEDVDAGLEPGIIALKFHHAVAEMIREVCTRIRNQTNLNTVTLSGGVFLNLLLLEETTRRLQAGGFRVFRHKHVPPNDGGICLGQLAIASQNRTRSVSEGRASAATPNRCALL